MISALRHEQMAKVGSRLRLHPELVGVTFPGPHDQADRAEVLRIAMKLPDWPTVVHDHNELVEGIGWVLDWLETFPGDGWHDRWIAAGANTDPDSWILRRHGQDPRIGEGYFAQTLTATCLAAQQGLAVTVPFSSAASLRRKR